MTGASAEPSPPEPSWGGCAIPVIVAVVFLTLGTCTVMTGVLQRRALAEFVDDRPLVLEPLVVSGAEAEHARETLDRIRSGTLSGTPAEVSVTAEVLNAWIATSPLLESLRETARVRAITEEAVVVEMSQELRGPRYLNGTFHFAPAPSETNTWQLILQRIEVPGRVVPPPFVRMYRDLHLFRFDAGNEELQTVLGRIDRMRLENGAVVVGFAAAEAPGSAPSRP